MTVFFWKRFAGFTVIGGIGFLIEATIISLLVSSDLGLTPTTARLFSFPCAVLPTWWLNRKYNFRTRDNMLSEGMRYLITQGIGAIANFVVFTICVYLYPFLKAWPVIALAIGAAVGLAVNYIMSSLYVFKERSI